MNTHVKPQPQVLGSYHREMVPYFVPKPMFDKDAYKTGHLYQYPPGTEFVYSNLTARGSKNFHWKGFNGKVVAAGMRAFVANILVHYWGEHFFQWDVELVVEPYVAMVNSALGAGAVNADHLRALHALGYLPLRIKALPEGELVNLRVPLMTVINTDPQFSWLTNFIETIWSNETWKPITVATIAYEYRRIFTYWAEATGAPLAFVPFQGHDFSARGMAGHGDSRSASVGHLFSFVGSDTLAAGDFATQYYGANWRKELILAAPPATEHAVMCMNYAIYGEEGTYRRLITEVYPTGMVAIVSDTINLWTVLDEVAPKLKAEIMARPDGSTGPGKVVFRPDSGEPERILCGDNDWPVIEYSSQDIGEVLMAKHLMHRQMATAAFVHYFPASPSGVLAHMFTVPKTVKVIAKNVDTGILTYLDVTFPAGSYGSTDHVSDPLNPADVASIAPFEPTPAEMGAFETLWKHFGGTRNERGYRTLDSHVGLVYGDSITLERADRILSRLAELGYASNNAVLGIGSFTYQYMTRDTFGLAIKATWAQIEGVGYDLQKKPATDVGVKHSAKGLMRVEKEGDDYVLYEEQTADQERGGVLEVIYENGCLHNRQSLADIRERLWPTVR